RSLYARPTLGRFYLNVTDLPCHDALTFLLSMDKDKLWLLYSLLVSEIQRFLGNYPPVPMPNTEIPHL
ncbi:MAG: hypothetical protein ABUK01_11805, partial [Leptospirales bacterium]